MPEDRALIRSSCCSCDEAQGLIIKSMPAKARGLRRPKVIKARRLQRPASLRDQRVTNSQMAAKASGPQDLEGRMPADRAHDQTQFDSHTH